MSIYICAHTYIFVQANMKKIFPKFFQTVNWSVQLHVSSLLFFCDDTKTRRR